MILLTVGVQVGFGGLGLKVGEEGVDGFSWV